MIAVHRKSSTPLHKQIYDSFRAAILEGLLRPGQRIPSSRVLAREIAVSRFPVLNAYAQLQAEGYLDSRVGAGTVIRSSLPEQLISSTPPAAGDAAPRRGPRRVARTCSLVPWREPFPWMIHHGPFRVGQVAHDQFPSRIWSSLVTRHCRTNNLQSLHYGDIMGLPRLRQAIANYVRTARSVRCEPEQILIVNGSQQALELSARALFDFGSRIWVEDPSYRLARDAFALNACRLEPIPVDAEGLNVAIGLKRCRTARGAFVTPSHQFPLGVTMSASRRLQLVEWAQRSGAWIIEDDYDSEYRYESLPIASLQGLDANSRVIYIGTFSKVLFPALRLGYIVIPADLVRRFVSVRCVMDLGPPSFFQEVLADFIEQGHFARHIRRMRTHYGELRQVLLENLRATFGHSLDLIGDEAGMHLTLFLQKGQSDHEIAERAVPLNLSLWPLSRAYLRRPRQGVILGFGGTSATEIPEAVRKLHRLLSPTR